MSLDALSATPLMRSLGALPSIALKLLCALTLLLLAASCRPSFEDRACVSDADCFSDETCSEFQLCLERTRGSLRIDAFEASPEAPGVGEPLTLSWSTRGGDRLTLRGPQGFIYEAPAGRVDRGEVVIEEGLPVGRHTLHLALTWGDLEKSASLVVVIAEPARDAPTIQDFESDSASVERGARVTLSWRIEGATRAEITAPGAAPIPIPDVSLERGRLDITPERTTSYTLVASNEGGRDERAVSVTVVTRPLPTIYLFESDLSVVPLGQPITLSWETEDGESIAITDESGDEVFAVSSRDEVAFSSVTLAPAQSERYTLTVTNPQGSVSSEPLAVEVVAPPVILSFSSSSSEVVPGSMVELSWEVEGAETVEIRDGSDALILSSMMQRGRVSVTIDDDDETYTLTVSNGAGSLSATISISSLSTPAQIVSFIASETMSTSGEEVTLSWETEDATSLQIVDDQGGAPIAIEASELDAGSIVVRAQVSTTYTLIAEGVGSSAPVTQQLTITVGAAPLLITEVLFAPSSGDDAEQWVEIYNAGEAFVDLSRYSLGWGPGFWAQRTLALDAVWLAPKQTHVIGQVSGPQNGQPRLDQTSGFVPPLGRGAVSANGVALFFLKASQITAASVPIDSVLWGGANSAGLLGESGSPDMEISPAPTGTSLARTSGSSDLFVDTSGFNPNTPTWIASVQPERGPNTATDALRVSGYALDVTLDDLRFGAAVMDCAQVNAEQLSCTLLNPTAQLGAVEVIAVRQRGYERDLQGNLVIATLPDPAATIAPMAFFFEGFELDLDAGFECATLAPSMASATAGSSIEVSVKVLAVGFTDQALGSMLPPSWVLQAAYFDGGVTPYERFGITWQTWTALGGTQSDDPIDSSYERFSLTLSSPTARVAEAAFRVSRDGGTSWVYCNAESAGGSSASWTRGVTLSWN